ncbi:MAG: hypothetical protein RIM84_01005 [Alphaproteobacteria bacterium]
MGKPLATLNADLVARVTPRPRQPAPPVQLVTAHRPPAMPMPRPRPFAPAATVAEPRVHWQRPRVIQLRPTQVEISPSPVSESTPMPEPTAPKPQVQPTPVRRRKATTVRLEPQLYARLRLAREQLDRTGQAILVEALNDWLAAHQTGDCQMED